MKLTEMTKYEMTKYDFYYGTEGVIYFEKHSDTRKQINVVNIYKHNNRINIL